MELLKDIAEIQTGVFAKPNVDGEVVYLQVNDFDESGNHHGFWVPTISLETLQPKHFLHQGDILFAAKGSKNFAAVRSTDIPIAVASTSFFVIRIHKQNILPEYVKWFLNQPNTIQKLKSEAKGTSIPSISKKSLELMQLPIIPLEKQKLILKINHLRIIQKEYILKIASLKDQMIQQQIFQVVNK